MSADYLDGLKGRRVFVTGASGFIGRRLVTALAAAKADVTVLARSAASARRLADGGIRTVTGTLGSGTDLAQALDGQSVLFHLAYDVRASAAENLRGFEQLMAAAKAAAVGRIIHTSSIVVYDAWPDRDIDETASMSRPGGSPYRQAKIKMEGHLMAGTIPAGILQPTIVYGPGSTLWTDHLASALARGGVVLPSPEGHCNGVFVDDVVQAALRAAVLPGLGRERFVISGDGTFLWSELLAGYCRIIGRGSVRHVPAAELAARLGPKPDGSSPADRPSLAARVSALARHVLGNDRFESLLNGLRGKLNKGGEMYPDHHLLEEFSGTGTCRIGHARQRLGYRPAFDLERGLEATAGHLVQLFGRTGPQ